jgi:hypothetical protein
MLSLISDAESRRLQRIGRILQTTIEAKWEPENYGNVRKLHSLQPHNTSVEFQQFYTKFRSESSVKFMTNYLISQGIASGVTKEIVSNLCHLSCAKKYGSDYTSKLYCGLEPNSRRKCRSIRIKAMKFDSGLIST